MRLSGVEYLHPGIFLRKHEATLSKVAWASTIIFSVTAFFLSRLAPAQNPDDNRYITIAVPYGNNPTTIVTVNCRDSDNSPRMQLESYLASRIRSGSANQALTDGINAVT